MSSRILVFQMLSVKKYFPKHWYFTLDPKSTVLPQNNLFFKSAVHIFHLQCKIIYIYYYLFFNVILLTNFTIIFYSFTVYVLMLVKGRMYCKWNYLLQIPNKYVFYKFLWFIIITINPKISYSLLLIHTIIHMKHNTDKDKI